MGILPRRARAAADRSRGGLPAGVHRVLERDLNHPGRAVLGHHWPNRRHGQPLVRVVAGAALDVRDLGLLVHGVVRLVEHRGDFRKSAGAA